MKIKVFICFCFALLNIGTVIFENVHFERLKLLKYKEHNINYNVKSNFQNTRKIKNIEIYNVLTQTIVFVGSETPDNDTILRWNPDYNLCRMRNENELKSLITN